MNQQNIKKTRLLTSLWNALGPIAEFVNEDGVQEISINGIDDVWVERKGLLKKEIVDISLHQINSAILLLRGLSGDLPDAQIINAQVEGFRFAAAMNTIAVRGPAIAIRKHNPQVLSLDDYVAAGQLTPEARDKCIELVRGKKNILVAGGTGTGKTTFINALVRYIDASERIVTIEDTRELNIGAPNWVPFEAKPSAKVTCRDLLNLALRFRPDRILMGEVRGPEAYDLMQAANTGHDGVMCTIHANTAQSTLSRVENLVLQADVNIPHRVIQHQIATTFNAVIVIVRDHKGRRVSEIVEVDGIDFETSHYKLNNIFKAED